MARANAGVHVGRGTRWIWYQASDATFSFEVHGELAQLADGYRATISGHHVTWLGFGQRR